jgi:hypothetical protein
MSDHLIGAHMATSYQELDPAEPAALRAHVQQCTFTAGVAHRLHCAMEVVRGFVAPRLVSVLLLTALLTLAMTWPFSTP